jgi:hypothetical protein
MGWYEAVKDAINVAQKADNLDLMRQLLEVQKEIQDMSSEMITLKNENRELREKLNTKENVKYDRKLNLYYTEGDEGRIDYCPVCWSRDSILAPVIKWEDGVHYCHTCKSYINKS